MEESWWVHHEALRNRLQWARYEAANHLANLDYEMGLLEIDHEENKARMCRKGLHELTGWNLTKDNGYPTCRQCKLERDRKSDHARATRRRRVATGNDTPELPAPGPAGRDDRRTEQAR